jgi:polysaccharide biosynthesis transport protein
MELEPWKGGTRSALAEASHQASNGNGKNSSFLYRINRSATEPENEDDLGLRRIFTVLRRRALLISGVTVLSTALASAWILNRPPSYKGNFQLLVEPVAAGSLLADVLTLDTLQTLQPIANQLRDEQGLDYVSQIEVLRSAAILEPIASQLQNRYPDLSYDVLVSRLKVGQVKDSKVLDVTYASPDPQEIQYVLSKLSQAYIRYSIEDRRSSLQRGIDFVDQQIQRQRQDVSAQEIRLEGFRRENDLVNPEDEARSLSDQISQMATEQRANRIKFEAAQVLYVNLQSQLGLDPASAIVAANLSQAPTYQALLQQLSELESKLAIESAQFRENTPVIQSLQDERDRLLPLLEREAYQISQRSPGGAAINPQALGYQGTVSQELTQQLVAAANDVEVLRTQDEAMRSALQTLEENVRNMAGVSRQYGQIRRDLDIGSGSLSRLLAARENLQLEIARQQNPWQLISKLDASNIENVSRIPLMLLAGGFAGLLLGLGMALLAEELDHAVKSTDELKDLPLPCLGVIPFYRGVKGAIAGHSGTANSSVKSHKEALFMEAFHSLDANIRLLSSDSRVRSLVVSSACSGEGKSTVASHLALAGAMTGRKVLLVDADFRAPQVHHLFNIFNERGLETAFSTDTHVSKLIQVSAQTPNLYLLPSGTLPVAPGGLLSSDKMKWLTNLFAKHFDLVIFDCSSLIFADAKLLASHTNGMVLVVGLGKATRQGLSQTMGELQISSVAPVLGMVVNTLKP